MPVIPALPPYGPVMTPEVSVCVAEASYRYQVPELLIHAIVAKEGGRPGKCSKNTDGSKDCGVAQINDKAWTSAMAKFNISYEHIKDNACLNIHVSAYIVRTYYSVKKDWFKAIMSYNIGPNNWGPKREKIGYKYASDVVSLWWQLENAKNAIIAHNSISAGEASNSYGRENSFEAPSPE